MVVVYGWLGGLAISVAVLMWCGFMFFCVNSVVSLFL